MGNGCRLNDVFERKIERKAGYYRQLASALHGPAVDRCRTAVAIASGTVDDYSLLLETVNYFSHALPGMLKVVFWEPFHEIEI